MDTNSQLAAYMDRALESKNGAKITLDSEIIAKRIQKYMINRRMADRKMQLKLHGISQSRWDILSFFREGSTVRIEKNIFENAQVEDL